MVCRFLGLSVQLASPADESVEHHSRHHGDLYCGGGRNARSGQDLRDRGLLQQDPQWRSAGMEDSGYGRGCGSRDGVDDCRCELDPGGYGHELGGLHRRGVPDPRQRHRGGRHAAARLDGRDAERARGQRRQHGPDAHADLRVGHVRLRRVGGEHRHRGDGDADEERFRRDDRISGRVRHDARRRGHGGRPAGDAGWMAPTS